METAETLKEKIELLNLPDDEREKVEEKFAPSLSYVSIDEMKAGLDVLNKKGEKITKAREVKILTIPASKIAKNYDFIEEAHEPNIYAGNILLLTCPVVDVFKRINFCRQYNIQYKNEDGTYKDFLFKESLFQQKINEVAPAMEMPVEEPSLTSEEPVDTVVPEVEMTDTYTQTNDSEHQNIKDYMAEAEHELENIEENTTTFEDIAKRLNEQKDELSAKLNEQLASIDAQEYDDSFYHFGEDLGTPMPETYDLYNNEVSSGRGR